jgi:hypothetical protein
LYAIMLPQERLLHKRDGRELGRKCGEGCLLMKRSFSVHGVWKAQVSISGELKSTSVLRNLGGGIEKLRSTMCICAQMYTYKHMCKTHTNVNEVSVHPYVHCVCVTIRKFVNVQRLHYSLSCLVLPYLHVQQPCPISYNPFLSCPISANPALPYLHVHQPCSIFYNPFLPCPIICNPFLSCTALSCPVLFTLTPTLPYFI